MAKDVITRFKLETTGFDSKIKQAAKELSDYSKTATQAKEGFDKFTKANVDAARALGSMATSTPNVKDRAKELVGAFNEAAKAYNSLTKEQQQSDWGKALAGSLTQLQQRIRETKQEMQGLGDGMKGGGLFSGLGDKMGGALQVFAGNMMTKAAGAVASLGSEMADMVKQGIELAKQGEGIRIAFERLGRGDILDGLREATHGTVTDIELMKAAVKFNDFRLPLDELGTMLAFAQQKAKDTGQSVDYMVDSIVTGLGRKSLMILDNLGLSASEIKERMAETGDMTKAVGAIIREQMAKAGDYVETAADRAAQANVSLQNKMEELGRKFAPVQEASNQLWTSMKIGILDVVGGPLARLLNGLTEAGRMRNALSGINAMGGEGQTLAGKHLDTLRQYSASHSTADVESLAKRQVARYAELEAQEWKKYNQQKSKLNQLRSEYGSGWGVGGGLEKEMEASRNRALAWRQVSAEYQAGAKQIVSPIKPVIDTGEAEQSITSLTKKLNDLQEQRKKAIAAGDTDLSKNLLKQINQTKADIKGLGGSVSTSPTPTSTKPTTAKEQTELQKNQQLITDLTQEYQVLADKAKTASGQELVAADDRMTAIQGEIRALQERNEELKRWADLAQGKTPQNIDVTHIAAPDPSKMGVKALPLFDFDASKSTGVSQKAVGGLMSQFQQAVQTADIGGALMQSLQAGLADATSLSTLLKTAIENGLNTEGMDFAGLKEQIGRGLDIPDEKFQELQAKINEQLQAMGLDPININFKTGEIGKEVVKTANDTNKAWQAAAQAISNAGSAMQNIEDPAAQVAGIVMQAIANIALGFAQAAASPATGAAGVFGWIAAATAGVATMTATIAQIKSATKGGFASGGIVPGNSFSGDNLRTADYGINSGELVLTRAQTNSLAAQLTDGDGGSQGGVLRAVVSAEQLRLVLRNGAGRRGLVVSEWLNG